MPVEDHPVHPSTKKGTDFRYGCWNRDEFSEAYYAMQRTSGTDGFKPTWWLERVRIPFRMSRQCQYDLSANDKNCEGCKRRNP